MKIAGGWMKRRAASGAVLLALSFGAPMYAQESSSRQEDPGAASGAALNSAAANGPAGALRDVLMAACSQSGNEFARYLTARSRQAFERLTPAARVALMKRFVLLNVPGKSTASANPSGRPLVRCETPDVTTEMAIGGAEVRDNVAFLPMELRDANDATGVSVHQVNMGMVREDGQWRLLSLGLLLLDLPALEVEWDAASADANEETALENLKKVDEAVETYRKTYASLPESLRVLGPPVAAVAVAARADAARAKTAKEPAASHEAAGLADAELAAGSKDGYEFRIIIVGASTLGAPAKYQLSATPSSYGRTGKRSFFRDADGGWHAADHRGAVGSESDAKIN
ncbi:MAG TPA: hypothetical protein VIM00_06630 [Candidatus Acidoferrum sp.]|jgi:hypothetical protein